MPKCMKLHLWQPIYNFKSFRLAPLDLVLIYAACHTLLNVRENFYFQTSKRHGSRHCTMAVSLHCKKIVFETRTATGREELSFQDRIASQIFILLNSNGEKILSKPMGMWLCEGKLKVKIAHFRSPSVPQKHACLIKSTKYARRKVSMCAKT